MMIALDVAYQDRLAVVGMVRFHDWDSGEALYTGTFFCTTPAAYIPGAFFRRELPCLIEALATVPPDCTHLLIDGYVHLRGSGRKGLGRHLYEYLAGTAIVIGIAKNPLVVAGDHLPVCRGRSRKPLYVSAMGMDTAKAAALVAGMHGEHRIPTMMKLADRLSRQAVAGQ